jgi:hypothetical protein
LKTFLADTFSDEEGQEALEGKTIYIQGSKQRILELCQFFEAVGEYVKQNGHCHMHFRDYLETWSKQSYIDVVVDISENT